MHATLLYYQQAREPELTAPRIIVHPSHLAPLGDAFKDSDIGGDIGPNGIRCAEGAQELARALEPLERAPPRARCRRPVDAGCGVRLIKCGLGGLPCAKQGRGGMRACAQRDLVPQRELGLARVAGWYEGIELLSASQAIANGKTPGADPKRH